MSTTYTTNYHLGKQTDTSDTFNMSVITDNMDIIDTAIATKASQVELEDLKNELNGIANITSPLSTADVKTGYSFNAADTLVNTGNLTRAAVVNVPLLKEKTIINTNFQFAFDITGDGKQEFISDDGEVWLSNGFIIPDGNNYNILFKRLDGENITSDDIAEIKQSFKQIENLSYSKPEIDQKIDNIDKSNLYGKTITAIGDSFIDYHTQGLGNDLLSKIADGKNMTIYNYGLSSSSLAYDSNQTVPSVMDRYQTMIAEVSQADYVIVLAGHNDSNAQLHGGSPIPIGNDTDTVNTTFKGALNILCDALLTAYPNAGILFLTPFRRRDTELPYCTAMEEVCANYSIPVFNNYKKSGICFNNPAQDTLYDNGNMHLNALGNDRVAKKYISILETL